MMGAVAQEESQPTELVAVGEAELARMRDRLAEIEAEYAMLEAELAVFEADYTREVVSVLAQLHDVEARILALSGECTHLACPVQDRTLKTEAGVDAPLTCPCHGGMFSQTGEVLAGPPERPLRRLQLDTLPAEPSGMLHLLEV